MHVLRLTFLLAAAPLCSAFAPGAAHALRGGPRRASQVAMQEDRVFELKLPLGDAGTANLRFKARLPESEAVVVRYDLSSGGFGLSVEPQGGRAVCTKDGAGGEKVTKEPSARPSPERSCRSCRVNVASSSTCRAGGARETATSSRTCCIA